MSELLHHVNEVYTWQAGFEAKTSSNLRQLRFQHLLRLRLHHGHSLLRPIEKHFRHHEVGNGHHRGKNRLICL